MAEEISREEILYDNQYKQGIQKEMKFFPTTEKLHFIQFSILNRKFHVIISANASSVCYTFRLQLCVPDSR